MPIFPGIAVLAGVVIDRALSSERSGVGRWLWSQFLGGLAVLSATVALAIVAAGRVKLPVPEGFGLAAPAAVSYLASASVAVWLMVRARAVPGPSTGRWGLVAVAVFLGITFTGPILQAQVETGEDVAAAVAKFKAALPPGTKLVSFGPVHHLFAYHYRDPIELRPLSLEGIRVTDDAPYFCYGWCDTPYRPIELPYFWQPVATISCERSRKPRPLFVVLVGRRLPTPAFPSPAPPQVAGSRGKDAAVR